MTVFFSRHSNARLSVWLYTPILYFLTATALLAHSGAHESIVHFTDELAMSPESQALYLQRGIIHSSSGQFSAAAFDFKQASRLGNPILVSCEQGLLAYRQGDYLQAKKHFDMFLQSFPTHRQCLILRARMFRASDDYNRALRDLHQVFALSLKPNPGLYLAAAKMMQSPQSDSTLDSALDLIDKANHQLGVTPQLQYYAIELELKKKDFSAAIERLLLLEPYEGQSPDWYVSMGDLFIQAGEYNDAHDYYQSAIDKIKTLRLTAQRKKLLLTVQKKLLLKDRAL